jgi:hypothetical protein
MCNLPRLKTPNKLTREMSTFYPNRQNSIESPAAQSLLSNSSKRGQATKERKLTECHQNFILVREKLSAL